MAEGVRVASLNVTTNTEGRVFTYAKCTGGDSSLSEFDTLAKDATDPY